MTIRTRKASPLAVPVRELVDVEVRGIDKDKRTATFCATTENGVEIWDGLEWLRMTGVDLVRYKKNPVVLDAHNRRESGCVIGRAPKHWVEGRRLLCEIEFAATKRAAEIWELVRDGFIKTLSIGYWPKEWKVLAEGEIDGEGEHQVKGPGIVVTRWELLEISTVPVPADPDALVEARSIFFEENNVAHIDKTKPHPITRAMTAAEAPPAAPAVEGAAAETPATGSEQPAAERSATTTPPAPEKKPEAPAPEKKPEPTDERAAKFATLKGERERLIAIAPQLRSYAEALLLKEPELDTEAFRARLLDEHAKRNAPVGTPEPVEPKRGDKTTTQSDEAKGLAGMTTDDFARAFKAS